MRRSSWCDRSIPRRETLRGTHWLGKPLPCLERASRNPSWQRSCAAATTDRTYDRKRSDAPPAEPLQAGGRPHMGPGYFAHAKFRDDNSETLLAMNPNLFVYGTLLSTDRHPKGERLRARRVWSGRDNPGQAISLGRYPGLSRLPAGRARPRRGLCAQRAGHLLAWLDAYEGIVPGDQERNDYARVERVARLASGEDITAWVYIYLKPVALAHLISGGRWVPPRIVWRRERPCIRARVGSIRGNDDVPGSSPRNQEDARVEPLS